MQWKRSEAKTLIRFTNIVSSSAGRKWSPRAVALPLPALGRHSQWIPPTCPAATPGDQPAPHRQPGPLQRQSVRKRDGAGQSCDRDVEQDPAGPTGGVRPHGQGDTTLLILLVLFSDGKGAPEGSVWEKSEHGARKYMWFANNRDKMSRVLVSKV